MNLSEAYPSRYLKADDLNGDPITLTIADVVMTELGQGEDKQRKLVLSFEDNDKEMVLNKTNAVAIAKLYGQETDEWVGKRITVIAREVDFKGVPTLALRVSIVKPKAVNKPEFTKKEERELAEDLAATRLEPKSQRYPYGELEQALFEKSITHAQFVEAAKLVYDKIPKNAKRLLDLNYQIVEEALKAGVTKVVEEAEFIKKAQE
jgi:hypothetical protein